MRRLREEEENSNLTVTEGSHDSFEQIAMRTKPQAPDFGTCKSGIMRSSRTGRPSCTLTFTGGGEETDLTEEVRLSGSEKICNEIPSQVTAQDQHNQKISTARLPGFRAKTAAAKDSVANNFSTRMSETKNRREWKSEASCGDREPALIACLRRENLADPPAPRPLNGSLTRGTAAETGTRPLQRCCPRPRAERSS